MIDDLPVVGCEACIAKLIPGHQLPTVTGVIGPPVPGLTADQAADRAADAGFIVLPHVLRDPDEVILVLACPHAAGAAGQ
jgi:hypothetical protein